MNRRNRGSVADLLADKGKGQRTVMRYFRFGETAAEAAEIDIASVRDEIVVYPRCSQAPPGEFTMASRTPFEAGTLDVCLRWASEAMNRGAEVNYCSAWFKMIECLAREYIPALGHVGLAPVHADCTGSVRGGWARLPRAPLKLMQDVKARKAAGALAISRGTGMFLWPTVPGCDALHLFAIDVLGYTEGQVPRHSRVYRDIAAE